MDATVEPLVAEEDDVHLIVCTGAGTQNHEFLIPEAFTIDQTKRAFFRRIPELAGEDAHKYSLVIQRGQSGEVPLTVEFTRLRNIKLFREARDARRPIHLVLVSNNQAEVLSTHQKQLIRPGTSSTEVKTRSIVRQRSETSAKEIELEKEKQAAAQQRIDYLEAKLARIKSLVLDGLRTATENGRISMSSYTSSPSLARSNGGDSDGEGSRIELNNSRAHMRKFVAVQQQMCKSLLLELGVHSIHEEEVIPTPRPSFIPEEPTSSVKQQPATPTKPTTAPTAEPAPRVTTPTNDVQVPSAEEPVDTTKSEEAAKQNDTLRRSKKEKKEIRRKEKEARKLALSLSEKESSPEPERREEVSQEDKPKRHSLDLEGSGIIDTEPLPAELLSSGYIDVPWQRLTQSEPAKNDMQMISQPQEDNVDNVDPKETAVAPELDEVRDNPEQLDVYETSTDPAVVVANKSRGSKRNSKRVESYEEKTENEKEKERQEAAAQGEEKKDTERYPVKRLQARRKSWNDSLRDTNSFFANVDKKKKKKAKKDKTDKDIKKEDKDEKKVTKKKKVMTALNMREVEEPTPSRRRRRKVKSLEKRLKKEQLQAEKLRKDEEDAALMINSDHRGNHSARRQTVSDASELSRELMEILPNTNFTGDRSFRLRRLHDNFGKPVKGHMGGHRENGADHQQQQQSLSIPEEPIAIHTGPVSIPLSPKPVPPQPVGHAEMTPERSPREAIPKPVEASPLKDTSPSESKIDDSGAQAQLSLSNSLLALQLTSVAASMLSDVVDSPELNRRNKDSKKKRGRTRSFEEQGSPRISTALTSSEEEDQVPGKTKGAKKRKEARRKVTKGIDKMLLPLGTSTIRRPSEAEDYQPSRTPDWAGKLRKVFAEKGGEDKSSKPARSTALLDQMLVEEGSASPVAEDVRVSRTGEHANTDFKKPSVITITPVPEAKKKDSKPADRKEFIRNEFIETEKKYVAYLKILIEVYQSPLQLMASPDMLTTQEIDGLFSKHLSMLYMMHHALLNDLLKGEKSFVDALRTFVPYLKTYTAYVNNFGLSTQLQCELTNSPRPKLQAFLHKCQSKPECHGLDLAALLIMPIQRLPRYELFLMDLTKSTEEESEKQQFQSLLECVRDTNRHVDKSKRKADNILRMFTIHQQLVVPESFAGWSIFNKQNREIIKEGRLYARPSAETPAAGVENNADNNGTNATNISTNTEKADDKKPAKERRRHTLHSMLKFHPFDFLLFNDVLLVTKHYSQGGKYTLQTLFYLHELQVGEWEEEQQSIHISTEEGQGPPLPYTNVSGIMTLSNGTVSIDVRANSADELADWVKDIHVCIGAAKLQMATQASTTMSNLAQHL